MTPTVVVTRRIPADAIASLQSFFTVDYNDADEPLAREELLRRIRGADALVTLLTDRVDADMLAAAPRLRVVANVAVGYDNVDVAAARDRGIAVTNTPGILTDATADFAWALLLAVARRVIEADRYVRDGRFLGWEMMGFWGGDLAGATLGIAGFGRIGQAVARRGRAFGMRVIYAARHRAPSAIEDESDARLVDRETLFAHSDVLSLHLPLNAATRHYVGAAELAMMKRTAYLVNTARGPVVDEAPLATALAEGRLAGAGLDVFEREPAVEPRLIGLPNVVLAPHIASATPATRTKMALVAAENAIAAARGLDPPNRVA